MAATPSSDPLAAVPKVLGWRLRECGRCRRPATASRFLILQVKPLQEQPGMKPEHRYDIHQGAWCLDDAGCRAWVDAQREKARLRNTMLILKDDEFPHAPKGDCRWCGERIVLKDPSDHRRARRVRHYGDSHEEGERDCRLEFLNSRFYNARDLCQVRDRGVCAECGTDEWQSGRWAADHKVPLWDGGEHTPENLQTLCDPCHATKTAAEARERAERRQRGLVAA